MICFSSDGLLSMSCMYEALAMTSQRPVVLLHNTTHVTNSDHVDEFSVDRQTVPEGGDCIHLLTNG